jgi:hypothetical protein
MEVMSDLEDLYTTWATVGSYPKYLPDGIDEHYVGDAFHHLFAGMVLYVFSHFRKAARHFLIAIDKNEEGLSYCTEMIVFHRVSKRLFDCNLFDLNEDQFVSVLEAHASSTVNR